MLLGGGGRRARGAPGLAGPLAPEVMAAGGRGGRGSALPSTSAAPHQPREGTGPGSGSWGRGAASGGGCSAPLPSPTPRRGPGWQEGGAGGLASGGAGEGRGGWGGAGGRPRFAPPAPLAPGLEAGGGSRVESSRVSGVGGVLERLAGRGFSPQARPSQAAPRGWLLAVAARPGQTPECGQRLQSGDGLGWGDKQSPQLDLSPVTLPLRAGPQTRDGPTWSKC